jgi:hypothetical protein
MTRDLTYQPRGQVGTVTLNRPEGVRSFLARRTPRYVGR